MNKAFNEFTKFKRQDGNIADDDQCKRVARMTFHSDNQVGHQRLLGRNGFCSEDPRYCPLTKDLDEEDRIGRNEELTPEFLKMHLDEHEIT